MDLYEKMRNKLNKLAVALRTIPTSIGIKDQPSSSAILVVHTNLQKFLLPAILKTTVEKKNAAKNTLYIQEVLYTHTSDLFSCTYTTHAIHISYIKNQNKGIIIYTIRIYAYVPYTVY